MQVCKSVIETTVKICTLYESPLPASLAYLPILDLLGKAGDSKTRDVSYNLLSTLCESCGPKLIINHVISLSPPDTKNLKALEAAIIWIAKTIDDFGLTLCDSNSIIEAAKLWMGSSNKGMNHIQYQCMVSFFQDVYTPRLSFSFALFFCFSLFFACVYTWVCNFCLV